MPWKIARFSSRSCRTRSPSSTRGAIGGFFGELRDRLLEACEADETPLAVILTPGPFNETYFEHAYLARQLGLPLVGGHRSHGSQRHGLSEDGRRIAPRTHDPASPRRRLLRSRRAAQRLGAGRRRACWELCAPDAWSWPTRSARGVLESAAWLGFLPKIAERLLGETLELPTLATWWCGEEPGAGLRAGPPGPARHQARMAQPALRAGFRPHALGRSPPTAHRAAAHPAACLCRPGAPGTFAGAGLATLRSVGFRGESHLHPHVRRRERRRAHQVMPGGLARIAANDAAADVVSTQRGGGSKDIWVLAEPADEDGGGDATTRLANGHPLRRDSLAAGREPLLVRPLLRAL